MSQRLKDNLTLLELLSSCAKSQIKSLLSTLSVDQVKILTEVLYNIQYATLPIPEDKLTYLQKKKSVIRKITTKGTSNRERKDLIVKNSALISVILKFSLQDIKEIITNVN